MYDYKVDNRIKRILKAKFIQGYFEPTVKNYK